MNEPYVYICNSRINSKLLDCHLVAFAIAAFSGSSVHRVRKILNLRLFSDENGKSWTKSVMDLNYEVLCVSQFTLQCVLKGNKPDFHAAMPTELAQAFYNAILENMRSSYKPELIKGERGSLDRLLAFFYFPVLPLEFCFFGGWRGGTGWDGMWGGGWEGGSCVSSVP